MLKTILELSELSAVGLMAKVFYSNVITKAYSQGLMEKIG